MESSILSEILMFVALLSTFLCGLACKESEECNVFRISFAFTHTIISLKTVPLVVICIWFTSEERIKASFE